MEYKTVRMYYGNGLDDLISDHIHNGWAVFSIWDFAGRGTNNPCTSVNSMQTIVTFCRPKKKWWQRFKNYNQ